MIRLGGTGVLRDKGVGDQLGEHAALQAAPLDRGHGVGDDVQLVPAADQLPADRLRVRQGKDALSQGGQIVPVALGRIPGQAERLQELDEPLQCQCLLGDLSTVERGPQLLIDPVIELPVLRRIGNIICQAHGGKGPRRGLRKIEQGVVRIKEQIGILHGEDSFHRKDLPLSILSHHTGNGNHRRPWAAYHGMRGNAG